MESNVIIEIPREFQMFFIKTLSEGVAKKIVEKSAKILHNDIHDNDIMKDVKSVS